MQTVGKANHTKKGFAQALPRTVRRTPVPATRRAAAKLLKINATVASVNWASIVHGSSLPFGIVCFQGASNAQV
jgi:hypothetical protein